MNGCPPTDRLELLVEELLTPAEQAAIARHLEGCSDCQAVLERLTTAAPLDSGATQALAEEGGERDFLEQLRQHPPTRTGELSGGPSTRPPIPGYELLRELGRGGMGVVYLARQLRLNRLTAVKMLATERPVGARELVRFQIEAEAIAALQHPNIVSIYEVGEHDGRPFLALEYVAGGSLAQQLHTAGQPLPPRDTAELVETLARAIHTAHQRGIVHRDLKPANVLLSFSREPAVPVEPAGRPAVPAGGSRLNDAVPKITDFGLAKQLGGGGPTRTQEVMGTPAYMAPEQACGEGHGVGPATDVYSLGALLYECLVGKPPFHGETPILTLQHVLHTEPTPPSRLRAGVPRDLETICLKCLNKEPGRRYASAEALADDLRSYRTGEPIRARPVGPLGRAAKWVRRHPAWAALAAVSVLGLLALAGGGVGLWYNARLQAALEDARQQRARAETLQRDVRYARDVQLAHQAWLNGQAARALDLLRESRVDRRGWEWHYLDGLCRNGSLPFRPGDGEQLSCAAFSADGKSLAIASARDHRVQVWDLAAGRRLHHLGGHTNGVAGLAFSGDGRWLASGSRDGSVKVWDAARGTLYRTLPRPESEVWAVAFSPDGARLACGTDAVVNVWNLGDGSLSATLREPASRVVCVTFSPDGRQLASVGDDSAVRLWDPGSPGGRLLRTLEGHTRAIRRLAYSPDGKWLSSAGSDYTVKVWEAATGRLQANLAGHTAPVESVTFSPDGKCLASAGHDLLVKLWDPLTAREVGVYRGHSQMVCGLVFSPDGQRLTSADLSGDVKAWDLSGPQEVRLLAGHHDHVGGIAFSPDGGRLASASADRTVRLWDLAGHRHQTLPGPNAVECVAFRGDGRRLAAGSWDGTMQLWDAAGVELRRQPGHTGPISAIAFSPDGRYLLTGGNDGQIKRWDADSGAELGGWLGHKPGVLGIAFSPDGRRLASTGWDGMIHLWESDTGQQERAIPAGVSWLAQVAFSPDGRRLAACGAADAVQLWDVERGEVVQTFRGHWRYVLSVAFSPDGRRLASGGWDRTVKVWDAAGGHELLTLKGHTGPIHGVAFSSDGRRLASAGAEALPVEGRIKVQESPLIRLWEAPPVQP